MDAQSFLISSRHVYSYQPKVAATKCLMPPFHNCVQNNESTLVNEALFLPDFLRSSCSICDDPVSVQQLYCSGAFITDADAVCEEELLLGRVAPFHNIPALNTDSNALRISRKTIGKRQSKMRVSKTCIKNERSE